MRLLNPSLLVRFVALTAFLAFVTAPVFAATATRTAPRHGLIDPTPRVAVISAFTPELTLLLASVERPRNYSVNGVQFTTGKLRGKNVVLFLSGVSMVNAAMNTQLALDRFNVTHIVFSGIAGGVNPALNIGDVVVAERWGQYLETLAARETAPGRFEAPGWMKDATLPAFGMWHPRPVGVRSRQKPSADHRSEQKFWFEADAAMLAAARSLSAVPVADCDNKRERPVCLAAKPRLVVGGNGVSAQVFVDNEALREYAFKTFEANVLDMETAATAMVAYSNEVPYIAFRSLSDLAGGGKGENEIETFFSIAADNSARVLMAFLAAWR